MRRTQPSTKRPKFLQQPMSTCYNGYMVNNINNYRRSHGPRKCGFSTAGRRSGSGSSCVRPRLRPSSNWQRWAWRNTVIKCKIGRKMKRGKKNRGKLHKKTVEKTWKMKLYSKNFRRGKNNLKGWKWRKKLSKCTHNIYPCVIISWILIFF